MPEAIIAENYTQPEVERKTRKIGETLYVYEDLINPDDKEIGHKLLEQRELHNVKWVQYEGFDSIRLVARNKVRMFPKTIPIRTYERCEDLSSDIRKHKREMNCQFWDVGDNW